MWIEFIFSFLFAIILFVSICGNLLILWIILGHRGMRTVPNFFLLNLAIADLGIAVLNTIPSFLFMRDGVWVFGRTYCKFNTFTSYLTVSASIFTLLALTVNRHKAIVTPLKAKATCCQLTFSLIGIWLVSGVLSLPGLLLSDLHRISRSEEAYVCIMIWWDGFQGQSQFDFIYNMVLFVVTYVLPLIFMCFAYTRMCRVLNQKVIGESTPSSEAGRLKKKQVIKMFSLVVGLFALCWLPYHLYFLIMYAAPHLAKSPVIRPLYLCIYWLAMSNSCINPIIYYFWNQRFRKHFDNIFRRIIPVYASWNSNTEPQQNPPVLNGRLSEPVPPGEPGDELPLPENNQNNGELRGNTSTERHMRKKI
ncbi:tachykinin-like peptides receptor 86C, partial [Eurytemora carolleeae]|uniref:tachykinin-like peptides receptor 86C n=1 Tax=Eurytemora carolleeae TaxID=1294199 RepID=UPI000C765633